jgi:hypothetical protein
MVGESEYFVYKPTKTMVTRGNCGYLFSW